MAKSKVRRRKANGKRGRKTKTSNAKPKSLSDELHDIYYTPATASSFGGIDAVAHELQNRKLKVTRKDLSNWLSLQETYNVHRPFKKRFVRNRVISNYPNENWQADLCDMTSLAEFNDGYKFLLTVCDV